MKAVVALDTFKSIYDKFRDEGIFDLEICRLINTAQSDVVREILYKDSTKRGPQDNPTIGFESNQWSTDDLDALLVYFDPQLNPIYTDANGFVAYAGIQLRLPSIYEYIMESVADVFKPEVIHIASIRRWHLGELRKVEWLRHNEHAQREENPFSESNDFYPTYRMMKEGIQLEPRGVRLLDLTVMRSPLKMWHGQGITTVDPELPDHIMVHVIYRALILGGINIRESQFTQLLERQELK